MFIIYFVGFLVLTLLFSYVFGYVFGYLFYYNDIKYIKDEMELPEVDEKYIYKCSWILLSIVFSLFVTLASTMC